MTVFRRKGDWTLTGTRVPISDTEVADCLEIRGLLNNF